MAPAYQKALKQLSENDVSLKIKALRELGELKATECVSDIFRLVEKDESDEVKAEAVRALGMIQDNSIGDKLIPLLDSNDVPLVMESVNTLGIFCANGFTKAVAPIEKLLDHSNFRVRKFAIEALGNSGSSTSIEKLFDYFRKEDASIETKELIARAIGKIGGPRAIEILKDLIIPSELVPKSIMEVRRAAIAALGESRQSAALEILGKVYNDKEEHKVIKSYTEEAIKKTIEAARVQYMNIKKRAEEILKGK
jgi:HEAT repeat protein